MVNGIQWNKLDITSLSVAKTWIREHIFQTVNNLDADDKNRLAATLNQLFNLDLSNMPIRKTFVTLTIRFSVSLLSFA